MRKLPIILKKSHDMSRCFDAGHLLCDRRTDRQTELNISRMCTTWHGESGQNCDFWTKFCINCVIFLSRKLFAVLYKQQSFAVGAFIPCHPSLLPLTPCRIESIESIDIIDRCPSLKWCVMLQRLIHKDFCVGHVYRLLLYLEPVGIE